MLRKILDKIKHSMTPAGPIQTFTYYIPAPPPRRNGYREKEFDGLLYKFINQGYEVLSVNTQAHQSAAQAGMWVIFTVKATSKKAAAFDSDFPLRVEELAEEPHQNIEKIANLSDL